MCAKIIWKGYFIGNQNYGIAGCYIEVSDIVKSSYECHFVYKYQLFETT